MKVVLSGNGYLSPILLNTFLTGFKSPWTPFQPNFGAKAISSKKSFNTCALPTQPEDIGKTTAFKPLSSTPVNPYAKSSEPDVLIRSQASSELEYLAHQINSRVQIGVSGDGITNYIPIARNIDRRTTLMIRNIPNKYTQEMLIDHLNSVVYGKFTFLYLRMVMI